MVTKKQEKEAKNTFFDGVYHFAVGRRKAAVAQVRVYCDKVGVDNAGLVVNGKVFDRYFMTNTQKESFLGALKVTGLYEKCSVSVVVKGGGLSGQADAARLGIARALVKYDDALRSVLRAQGFLTRDARVVERKKPGLRKARRAPQWAKR
ncbi:MAG: 30S ribosomal protein S9 [Parcubacteria group bacterium]|jgi:small subunit ribosomal protein S9